VWCQWFKVVSFSWQLLRRVFFQQTATKFNFSLHLHSISYFLYITYTIYINFIYIAHIIYILYISPISCPSPTYIIYINFIYVTYSLPYPLHHLHTSPTSTSSTSHTSATSSTSSTSTSSTVTGAQRLHISYKTPTMSFAQGLLHKRSQEFLHRSCYTVGP
jgi:hypothetical protein